MLLALEIEVSSGPASGAVDNRVPLQWVSETDGHSRAWKASDFGLCCN